MEGQNVVVVGMVTSVRPLFTRDKDPFIVIFGSLLEGASNQVLIVNKQNIIWIAPED